MSDGTREQLFLVNLWVDGVDCGIWDKWDGGDKDTDNTQYRAGGSPSQENLGGGITYSAITLTRNYRLSRDRPVVGFLFDKVGSGSAKATKQPLDRSYNAYGNPIVAVGLLKTINDPKVDSMSNNPATLSVVIEPDIITAT